MELSRGAAQATRFVRLRKHWIVATESAEQIAASAAERKRRIRYSHWRDAAFYFAGLSPSLCVFFHSL